MRVATHSVKAYAGSRGISLYKAFEECFIGTHEREPRNAKEYLEIANDLDRWRRENIIPKYVSEWLDQERIRQMQEFARAGPNGFAHFS